MHVKGKYKRFWGSDQWSIKIDFTFIKPKTIENLSVEFKNDKTGLFNSLEVSDFCSCVSLMMRFAEGFGIAIFDRRLVNWMAEYFNEHEVKIDSKSILNCLKKELDEKIDVKVNRLTIADKTFTDILEYNPNDLLIDFDQYFVNEKWIPGDENVLNFPIMSSVVYEIEGSKKTNQNTTVIKNNYNGTLDVDFTFLNDKNDTIDNIIIEDLITKDFRPNHVIASLIAPDKTVLGVFQPLEINDTTDGLKIVWKINELKINHRVKIEYILVQRVPFIINLNTEDKENNYLRHIDVLSDEDNKFLLKIPALVENNVFSKNKIQAITALFPIEFETQSILYLYPHYILKIIDQGYFQKIIFSELFVDALFFDEVTLDGSILPVLSLYESFVPQIGSKIIKKIFRNHSFTNPMIMYNLETSSSKSLEIVEEYPNSTIIKLLTLGDQELHEQESNSNKNTKNLLFFLNATNDTILFSITGSKVFDLEKALTQVRDTDKTDPYEIFQTINVESIVDQTNKNYLDFKNFKIISDSNSDNIRLRSFTLKINEKVKELESQVKDSELDKAFETLKQTETLELLKSKIKDSYSSNFSNEDESSIQTEKGLVEEPISIENGEDLSQSDEKETIIVADEGPDEGEDELAELDSFINDFGKESEDSSKISFSVNNDLNQQEENIDTIATATMENGSSELDLIENDVSVAGQQINESRIEETISEKKKPSKKSKKKSKKKVVKKITSLEESSLEFTVIFEEASNVENILPLVLESESKINFINKNQENIESKSQEKPDKIYLKITKNDRYLILLLNPREYLAAHIYGRWKERNIQIFKILLSTNPGLWHIRVQLLESGSTYDLDFKIN